MVRNAVALQLMLMSANGSAASMRTVANKIPIGIICDLLNPGPCNVALLSCFVCFTKSLDQASALVSKTLIYGVNSRNDCNVSGAVAQFVFTLVFALVL